MALVAKSLFQNCLALSGRRRSWSTSARTALPQAGPAHTIPQRPSPGRAGRMTGTPRRQRSVAMDPTVGTLVELNKVVHGAIRRVVADLDAEALAWTPGAETSSIAVLVVHTLGSEAAVLRQVRGLPWIRD